MEKKRVEQEVGDVLTAVVELCRFLKTTDLKEGSDIWKREQNKW